MVIPRLVLSWLLILECVGGVRKEEEGEEDRRSSILPRRCGSLVVVKMGIGGEGGYR